MKLLFINKVKDFLGIQYTFDYSISISRDWILNCSSYLTENRSDIYNVFNVAKNKKSYNVFDFKKT